MSSGDSSAGAARDRRLALHLQTEHPPTRPLSPVPKSLAPVLRPHHGEMSWALHFSIAVFPRASLFWSPSKFPQAPHTTAAWSSPTITFSCPSVPSQTWTPAFWLTSTEPLGNLLTDTDVSTSAGRSTRRPVTWCGGGEIRIGTRVTEWLRDHQGRSPRAQQQLKPRGRCWEGRALGGRGIQKMDRREDGWRCRGLLLIGQ